MGVAHDRLPRWTHIALRVRDIEASIGFYVEHAHLDLLTRRTDEHGFAAWLGHDDQREAPFVLVLAEFLDQHEPNPEQPDAPIGPFAHLGIELASAADVDAIAEQARSGGYLQSGPMQLPDPIGYICMVSDPDGNTIEFSHGQRVFEFAAKHMSPIPQPGNVS